MYDDSKSEAYDWHMVNQEWSKQQATINTQAARIAELEQALRDIQTLAHEVPANSYTFRCQQIKDKATAALGK